ncbi:MAG: alpha/beta hydrolase [Myxococcales bacterium]|nr:alpha/beta hydrolase [Myxococcales bacterium]
MTHRLFHSVVVDPTREGRPPERWALFLHGILGSGANWRTFAKRVVARCPAWGAALVDLRLHGNSQSLAPPHTVAACAEDLFALHPLLDAPVRAVVGHSFGGKVALAYSALRAELASPIDLVVSVDSNPGLREDATGSAQIHAVISALESLPPLIASREAFSTHMRERGLSDALVAWLMMNLRPVDGGFAVRLDLAAIRAMLADYFARDDWALVEQPTDTRVAMVVGGQSAAFSQSERDRIAAAARAHPDRVALDVIERSGHWVHVDAPDELFEIVTRELNASALAPR